MSKNKTVSVEVDVTTIKKLGRASKALSQLAGAYIHAIDNTKKG